MSIERKKYLWLSVRIPYAFVSPFLSNSARSVYDGKWLDLEIDLHIEVVLFSEYGRKYCERVGYIGEWAVPLIGNYPDPIKDAIDLYIQSINVNNVFRKELSQVKESYEKQ